jgi:hypothetical protein
MNERDKELAKQAWTENDWEGHVNLGKFAELIRADQKEIDEGICNEVAKAFQNKRETAQEQGADSCAIAIRARGNP